MESGRQVFTVDLLERYAAKGRGVITCMAAGNDVILLGTSKGWLIRHDFGVGDSYGSYYFPIPYSLRCFVCSVRETRSFLQRKSGFDFCL
jgi:hypothetical protein